MATITNQAALSYNGITTLSNITVGELVEVLSATKSTAESTYSAAERKTYVVSLVNTGPTALTGLTVSDDLGGYAFNTATVYPMTYVDGSLLYYVGGVLQPTPTVTAGPPLTVSGISVPAGGNAALVYEVALNEYAPPTVGGTVTNTATISGSSLVNDVTASATVSAVAAPDLSITKAMSPVTVTENGTVTYTLTLIKRGNTAAATTDELVLTDTFDPILSDITVSFEGLVWTEGTQYTYDSATGLFTTTAGALTVPAATFTQDASTGAYTVTPGTATLTITGTL